MNLIKKTIALSLLVVCANASMSNGFGQQRRVRRGTTPDRRYSTQPFDPSIDSLTVNFPGHNAAEIYRRMVERKHVSAKGEFETTEDYRKRMIAIASKPLLGSLTPQSVFAFVVNDIESEYDADMQVLHATSRLSMVREGVALREKGMSVSWNIINRNSGSYVGTNAFGARVRVDSTVSDFYEIAIENYQQFAIRFMSKIAKKVADNSKRMYARLGMQQSSETDDYLKDTALAADLNMDAQTALRAKKNLRLLLVCRLAEPYIIDGTTYRKATIDDPQEFFIKIYSVNTELSEVWFFDSSTGEVYAKQKPRQPSPQVASTTNEKTERAISQPCLTIRARIISKPEPQYTLEARQAQITGTVVLSVVLEANGKVTDIQVKSGLSHGLTEKAIEAAKQVRFAASEANCQKVSQRVQLEYNFNLY